MKITITINDKIAEKIKKLCNPGSLIFIISVILFSAGLYIFSQEAINTKRHIFKPGDIISAGKINENFEILYANVKTLNNRTLVGLKDVDTTGLGNGKVLKYDNGNWIPADDLTGAGGGDNLGNHTATQNINLNGNWLSGTAMNNGIYVDGNGNVGINKDSPGYALDITGTVQADSFRLNGQTITQWPAPGTGDGHSLDASDGNPADVVYVNASGNVGVGTTNPESKLQVSCSKQGPINPEDRAAVFAWNSGGDGGYPNPIAVYGKADSVYSSNGFAGFFEGRGYFSGNVGIGTQSFSRKFFVSGDAGGTTAWSNDSHSSYKQKFKDVNVLEKIRKLDIKEWEYKPEHTTADNSRHLSPFAEEFHKILGLGDSEKQIQALDVAGVALKAIQEQQEMIEKQQKMIEELKKEIEQLKNK